MEFDGTDNKEKFTPDNRCSWCLKEKNIAPRAEDSHGMCKRHFDAVMAEFKEKMDKEERDGKDD
uniref:Uncharacterized protein n=1 Tax=viral metagenome TaxID=1070528 RepID=A0A6M3JH14_9ZZZZ